MGELEYRLYVLLRASFLPLPKLEYRFHPVRRWRFDLAWPEHKIALEVEGGIWSRGRHVRAAGYEEDCRKYNHAVLLGWRVLRVTVSMIDSGEALNVLKQILPHG